MTIKRIQAFIYLTALTITLTLYSPQLMAQSTVINFDGIADGTVINNYYAGITFSNPLVQGGLVYARNGYGSAPSSPNVASVFDVGYPAFHAYYGAVDATFTTPQSYISIDARPVAAPEGLGGTNNRPFLEAYSGQTLIGKVLYAGALPPVGGIGATETLTVTSSAGNITRVRFSTQQGNGYPIWGLFDNLRIGPAGGDDYVAMSKISLSCLDVYRASEENGAPVVQGKCTRSKSQIMTNYRVVDSKYLTLILQFKHSGKALDVRNQSTMEGAQVVQWTSGGSRTPRSQWWTPVLVKFEKDVPYYQLVNGNSGLCLDAREASGENVFQSRCTGADTQLWDFLNMTKGTHGF